MTHTLSIITLIALALLAPRADAGTPCGELLAEKAYRCQVRTAPDAAPSERCMEFRPSERGILTERSFCSCTPRGKLGNLTFDASAEFVCAGVARVPGPVEEEFELVTTTMSGLATRTAIKRGFTFREDGLTEAFECVLDPSCARPPE